MEKHATNKNWKRNWKTYCLVCKDNTNNFIPQEKSNCVICQSSQSRFLKQKHKNKK